MKTKLKRFLISILGLGCWFCYRRLCSYKRLYNNCNYWKQKDEDYEF